MLVGTGCWWRPTGIVGAFSFRVTGSRPRMSLSATRNWAGWYARRWRRAVLLKIAGVRSESQFARGTHEVSVRWNDAEPVMTLEPYRSDGRGFVGIRGHEITLDAAASDAVLGATIRRALAIAAGGA